MIEFDAPTLQRQRTIDALNPGGPHKEPPAPVLLDKPKVHHVVAWRHDGEVRKTAHETKELALAFGAALHWAIVWKYAVMDGRDMLLRQLVNEPE